MDFARQGHRVGGGIFTTDGLNALKMDYNFLNLTSVARDMSGAVKAKYTWNADGAKLSVRDASGAGGLEYAGSLIYKRTGASSLALEGAAFGGGRIMKTTGAGGTDGYETNYFVTDHLGSTRVVVDSQGGVKGRSDFYPFGSLWSDAGGTAATRYLYNGKEQQLTGGIKYFDFGARMYDPEIGRWHVADPLAFRHRWLSPFAYCADNPLKYSDPDGKDYQLTIDKRYRTMTVNATYYTDGRSYDFAYKSANTWNRYTGLKYNMDGVEYDVKYNLTVMNVGNPVAARKASERDHGNGRPGNSFVIQGIAKEGDGTQTLGVTRFNRDIEMDYNRSKSYPTVGEHEIGHTLGMANSTVQEDGSQGPDAHAEEGLMTAAVNDPKHSGRPSQVSVDESIQGGIPGANIKGGLTYKDYIQVFLRLLFDRYF